MIPQPLAFAGFIFLPCVRTWATQPLFRSSKMQYRLSFLFGVTTIVAVVAAVMAQLGGEKGLLFLFLVIADAVSVVRFYRFLNGDEPDIAWTVFTAAVTFPLTILLVIGAWI